MLDLARAVLQSFDIAADLPGWLADGIISKAFEAVLAQPFCIQSPRKISDEILPALDEQSKDVSTALKEPLAWSPGNSPLGSPSLSALSMQGGYSRVASLSLPTKGLPPLKRATPSTMPRRPHDPVVRSKDAPGDPLLTPPNTVREWRLEETPPSMSTRKGLLRPIVQIPRSSLVSETIQDWTIVAETDQEMGVTPAKDKSQLDARPTDPLPSIVDLTEVDDESEAETIRHNRRSEDPESRHGHRSESEHERASLLSSFGAGRNANIAFGQRSRGAPSGNKGTRHAGLHPNFWTNPYGDY